MSAKFIYLKYLGLMKRILMPWVLYIAKFYFKIRHFYTIWFYILNNNPRRLFKKNKPKLDRVQEDIISDLKKKGIAVTHIDDLFVKSDILTKLQDEKQRMINNASVKTGKTFLMNLWPAVPVLDMKSEFVKLSLSKRVLDIVNSYLEMYSNFYAFSLNITTPISKNDEEAIASQRWHRDPEDKKMIKMFIYLNDVDENSGPFTYVPESVFGMKWGKVFPQIPPRGVYPNKNELEGIIPKDMIIKYTGKAGTIIFCDTTGLHYGGYALKNERIMYTAGYRTRASAWDAQLKYPKDFLSQIPSLNLSEAASYALYPNYSFLTKKLLKIIKGNK